MSLSNPPKGDSTDQVSIREQIKVILDVHAIEYSLSTKRYILGELTPENKAIKWRNQDNSSLDKLEKLITSKVNQARIDELERLLRRRDCLRPWCKVEHTYLTKLYVKARLKTLKRGMEE